jgi:hypothetical protein
MFPRRCNVDEQEYSSLLSSRSPLCHCDYDVKAKYKLSGLLDYISMKECLIMSNAYTRFWGVQCVYLSNFVPKENQLPSVHTLSLLVSL